MKRLELKKGKALVIVAHPDDETIWLGGTILAFPQVHWTILSLCRKNDSDRYPKFKKAIKIYRGRLMISDLEDEGIMKLKESVPEIKKKIKKALERSERFAYLFTHGYNGEYGHLRHRGVHRAVRALIQKKVLTAEKIFYFCQPVKMLQNNIPKGSNADFFFKLKPAIYRKKKFIIEKIYGFSSSSFESKSCSDIETFKLCPVVEFQKRFSLVKKIKKIAD